MEYKLLPFFIKDEYKVWKKQANCPNPTDRK